MAVHQAQEVLPLQKITFNVITSRVIVCIHGIWICRLQRVDSSIISPLGNSYISGRGTLPLNLMYPSDTLVIHDSHCKEFELGTELLTGFLGHCTDEKAFPLEVSCRGRYQDPLLQYHSWASVWSHCQKESLKWEEASLGLQWSPWGCA